MFTVGTTVGIVALGSSGEAVHLSHDERREVLLAARQVLDSDASLAAIPLIAGTPASSTRETIELTRQAAECGANFAMVITPGPSACLRGRRFLSFSLIRPPLAGYFAGALTRAAIKQFFTDVAEASPIPMLVYNYPGASAGIDIDSELMSESAFVPEEQHPLPFVKLTSTTARKLRKVLQTLSAAS